MYGSSIKFSEKFDLKEGYREKSDNFCWDPSKIVPGGAAFFLQFQRGTHTPKMSPIASITNEKWKEISLSSLCQGTIFLSLTSSVHCSLISALHYRNRNSAKLALDLTVFTKTKNLFY